MKPLEARILRLEAAQKRVLSPGRFVARLVSYADGEIIGFTAKAGDVVTTVNREPGESEEALAERATLGLAGFITIREIREGNEVPYKLPYEPSVPTVAAQAKPEEAKPEPIPPRIVPRPAPKEEIIILGSVERQHGIGGSWGFMG